MSINATQTAASNNTCQPCSAASRVATYGTDLPNSADFFQLNAKLSVAFPNTPRVRTDCGGKFGVGGTTERDWNRSLAVHQIVVTGFSIDTKGLPEWAASILRSIKIPRSPSFLSKDALFQQASTFRGAATQLRGELASPAKAAHFKAAEVQGLATALDAVVDQVFNPMIVFMNRNCVSGIKNPSGARC